MCILIRTSITIGNPVILVIARAAEFLATHIIDRPIYKNEPIPWKDLISKDKFQAEVAMEEIKINLG